jgi:predicted RNA-binding protein with PIN domain
MLLLDGHNLIGRSRTLRLDREEESRLKLLERVAAAKGAGGQPVWVVFDGNRPGRPLPQKFGGVRVCYSSGGRTADEEILKRVEALGPGRATVVTSDRGLADRARARGARILTAEEFLSRLERPRSGPASEKPSPDAEDVERWLEEFEGE